MAVAEAYHIDLHDLYDNYTAPLLDLMVATNNWRQTSLSHEEEPAMQKEKSNKQAAAMFTSMGAF